jgi:hypothetical protein
MKKILSIALVLSLLMAVLVPSAMAADRQYVVGIAEAQANDEVTTRRAYLEKYLGPHYNVRFIFSEVLKDDAATKQFIENCIDAGADAIIDMKSASGQMARLCEENDVVYVVNGDYKNHPELTTEDYPLFGGCTGANNPQVGSLFRDWLDKIASEDGSEGFLIASTMAPQGNSQHVEICRAILTGLQLKYGLTYTKSIDELIATDSVANVENDKGILITLFPGSPNKDTWLPGLSPLLQTGKYGVFMSSGQTYDKSAQVVAEVEKAFGIDIKIASVAALGTTLSTAFNTKDPSGNPSVDLAAVKSISCMTATMFAAMMNMLAGKRDTACRNADGTVPRYTFGFIAIQSPEELANTGTWDNRDANSWIADYTFVDRMMADDATPEKINEQMSEVDYAHITEWMSQR